MWCDAEIGDGKKISRVAHEANQIFGFAKKEHEKKRKKRKM